MSKSMLLVASISGLLAVALGAFGAHGLEDKVSMKLLSAYKTGVQYQMYHSLALFALGVLMMVLREVSKPMMIAACCWVLGIILFSGSLYGMALGGPSWLGPITPVGGLLLMAGWVSLIVTVLRL